VGKVFRPFPGPSRNIIAAMDDLLGDVFLSFNFNLKLLNEIKGTGAPGKALNAHISASNKAIAYIKSSNECNDWGFQLWHGGRKDLLEMSYYQRIKETFHRCSRFNNLMLHSGSIYSIIY
jgi:hypothetical protein